MKSNVYSIYDVKAKEYGPLFLAKNDDVSIRMVKNLLKDVQFPQDYELFCVGDFDNESGELHGSLDIVCNLLSVFMPMESSEESDK